ncbi:hypothetical protein H1Q59_07360 [Holosporaceae bacterium 'Namur']|nr:hypothetical protein [Holosporaceae bacterium 'Namur']
MRERFWKIVNSRRTKSIVEGIKEFFFFFPQNYERDTRLLKQNTDNLKISQEQKDQTATVQNPENEADIENKPSGIGRAWNFTKKAFLVTKDVVTSTSFCRVTLIASSALLFATAPVAPWLAGIGLTAAVGAVVGGLTVETYRRYKLGTLKKEDKLLNKLTDAEVEKNRDLEKLKGKEIPEKEKENYKELLSSLEKELYKFPGYDEITHKTSLLKAMTKAGIFTGPENFVNIGVSLIAMDPLSFSVSVGTTILGYNQEVKKTKRYNDEKVKLLTDMEAAKSVLGISYENGKGLPILKDIVNLRLAENIATQDLMNKVNTKFEKGQEIEPKVMMQEFEKLRGTLMNEFTKKDNIFAMSDKKATKEVENRRLAFSEKGDIESLQKLEDIKNLREQYKDQLKGKVESQETLPQKAGNFLKTMGKVAWYGFSVNKTQEMFSPVRKHEDYTETLKSLKESKELAIQKVKEPEIQKDKPQEPLKEDPNFWRKSIKPVIGSHRQNDSHSH